MPQITTTVPAAGSAQHLRLRQRLVQAQVIIPSSSSRSVYHNWARSYRSVPSTAFQPSTEEECRWILELAQIEGKVVRAVGSGHSPSDLPCTTGFMVRMDRLNQLLEINHEKSYVVAQAGMVLTHLNTILISQSLALSNLGSICDTTIAGVISTGTHGSGLSHGCLSTQVLALHLMLSSGQVIKCSREENKEIFLSTLCGLGTTGLIVRVCLKVEKAFKLKEIRTVMDIDDVVENVEDLSKAGEYVRMWWSPQTKQVSVMTSSRTIEPPLPSQKTRLSYILDNLISGYLCEFLMFLGLYLFSPLEYLGNYIRSLIVLQSQTLIDQSDKILNVDCGFLQYTTEWCIPYSETKACLRELKDWLDHEMAYPWLGVDGNDREDEGPIRPSFPIEIRWSAPDDIWLSPAYGNEPVCWIGIVKYKPYAHSSPFKTLSHKFESILKSHSGKPHWAKSHSFAPSNLRDVYPRFDDFVKVVQSVDSEARFRNEYVQRHIFGVGAANEGCESIYAKSV